MTALFAILLKKSRVTVPPDAPPSLRLSFCPAIICLILAFSPLLEAKPVERELGKNLRYFRAFVLPQDLPVEAKPGPIILDLRYALAESDAGTALNAWLAFRATDRTPVFVLLNTETAPALRDLFLAPRDRQGVVTIGRAGANFVPDVAISTTEAEERQAYNAFEQTPAVETLITENPQKPRLDEAAMMRERSPDDAEAEDDPPVSDSAAKKPSDPPVTLPIDRPLQRAVHLHRAMMALKQL